MVADKDTNVNVPKGKQGQSDKEYKEFLKREQERINATFIPQYSEEFIHLSEQQYNEVLGLIGTQTRKAIAPKKISDQEINFLMVVAFLQYKYKRIWLTTGEITRHMQKSPYIVCKRRNMFKDKKLLLAEQRLPSSLYRNEEGYDNSARYYELAPLFKRLIALKSQVQS